ncbi:PLDc N-terminal domain-containing protein [Fibrisoma limi]|uniref:PLDc N-terminal domain-containing protein n=1 Tax=Fibrisoma limi TaxID=663275 RepID=UPI00030A9818|nr:PLDc N-terminal domain-containing protein [Fibrisoma limi]
MELFIGLGDIELTVLLAVIGFFVLLPLIALIDALRSSFRESNDKLVWVLVILFFPFLGAILYFVMGRNQRIS